MAAEWVRTVRIFAFDQQMNSNALSCCWEWAAPGDSHDSSWELGLKRGTRDESSFQSPGSAKSPSALLQRGVLNEVISRTGALWCVNYAEKLLRIGPRRSDVADGIARARYGGTHV